MLIMPIIVLFYQDNGLSMQEIMTLKGINAVAVVLLEIPSGYFADVWGRKQTLILGSILGTVGFVLYSIGYGFWGFLAAEIVLGIGQSFISGSDSALLYDSLLHDKREDEYLKQESRQMSIGNFAEALAGIIGGLLASISLRTPFLFQTGIAFLAIPAALLLVEPTRSAQKEKAGFLHILHIVKYAIIDNAQLRWNIVFSAIIGCATLSMAWFIQAYFVELNLTPEIIGILWTLLNLTVGLVAWSAPRIEQKLGKIRTSLLIGIGISSGFLLIGSFQSIWAIAFLFLFYMVRGVATPILKDYINRITESEVRATVLSMRNFIIRTIFAILGPFLGWYTDKWSLTSALFLAGVIFLIISAISIFFIRKIEKP